MVFEQLGQAIGRDKATIWQYEQGDIEVSPTILEKIARLFGFSPRIFFEDKEQHQGNVEKTIFIAKNVPLYVIPASAGSDFFVKPHELFMIHGFAFLLWVVWYGTIEM